jgi:hypothetical protein
MDRRIDDVLLRMIIDRLTKIESKIDNLESLKSTAHGVWISVLALSAFAVSACDMIVRYAK